MTRKKRQPGEAIKVSSLKELAEKRVPRAIKAINLCGNLVTRKPTDEQKEKIVEALKDAVTRVEKRFEGVTTEEGFEL